MITTFQTCKVVGNHKNWTAPAECGKHDRIKLLKASSMLPYPENNSKKLDVHPVGQLVQFINVAADRLNPALFCQLRGRFRPFGARW